MYKTSHWIMKRENATYSTLSIIAEHRQSLCHFQYHSVLSLSSLYYIISIYYYYNAFIEHISFNGKFTCIIIIIFLSWPWSSPSTYTYNNANKVLPCVLFFKIEKWYPTCIIFISSFDLLGLSKPSLLWRKAVFLWSRETGSQSTPQFLAALVVQRGRYQRKW